MEVGIRNSQGQKFEMPVRHAGGAFGKLSVSGVSAADKNLLVNSLFNVMMIQKT